MGEKTCFLKGKYTTESLKKLVFQRKSEKHKLKIIQNWMKEQSDWWIVLPCVQFKIDAILLCMSEYNRPELLIALWFPFSEWYTPSVLLSMYILYI